MKVLWSEIECGALKCAGGRKLEPKLSDFLIVVQFLTQKGQESVCFRCDRLEETVRVWAATRENDAGRELLAI